MRWLRFFRRRYWDEERAREIEAYLELETDDNIARGMSARDARYAAQRKLGNAVLIREEIYHMNTIGLVETVWRDLRYATRVLRKSPAFTGVAVLSLALGIGVNTAVFSVVNAVLLRSLPYPKPVQLVRLGNQGGQGEATIPEYEFWKEHSAAFSSMAGVRGVGERRLRSGTEQEWIKAMTVTADFLRTLGIDPALGREFNSEETHAGGPQALIVSDGLWRKSFGADPEVLGRAVALDDATFTIVGVLPAGFWFPQAADALAPLRPTGSLSDRGTNTQVIARLKDDVSLRQAAAEMATITENFRRENAGSVSNEYRGLTAIPYQDWLVGDVRLNLLLLFGATGLLLLIACSNLASLLLARLAARGKELAVRLALGSSRRLLQQLLIENLLLAGLGTLVGLAGAYGLLGGLVAVVPFNLPASSPIHLDRTVLAFTLVVALGTTLLFTFVPFLSTARLNVLEALKSVGRTAGAGSARQRTRNFLVIGQVALSAMLLVAAGLLIQTLYRLHQERLGFAPQGLITFETPLAADRRKAADLSRFASSMLERFQAVPGVRGVAAVNVLPLTGWSNLPTQRDGHPEQSIGGMEVRLVTPSFFEVMGIPIRRGRPFAESDSGASPAVALVNETLARTWWPQADAVGDRIIVGRYQGRALLQDPTREVVGVVADTKAWALKEPPRPTVFVPISQATDEGVRAGSLAWIVSTNASAGIAESLRRAIVEMDSGQRVRQFRTMEQIVASTSASSRFNAWLFTLFAGVALALAAIGVYGVLSFSVAQRRHEIGTRMALGAARADVLKLVLKQGLALTAIGLAAGLAGGLFLARWLSSLLFGVQPDDPLIFGMVALLLLFAGLTASYLPARRATRIDPMVALRDE